MTVLFSFLKGLAKNGTIICINMGVKSKSEIPTNIETCLSSIPSPAVPTQSDTIPPHPSASYQVAPLHETELTFHAANATFSACLQFTVSKCSVPSVYVRLCVSVSQASKLQPLSTVCHFLACRANFKTCKESHREEEAGQFQIPLNWATELRVFGCLTVNLPLASLKLRNPTLLPNQPLIPACYFCQSFPSNRFFPSINTINHSYYCCYSFSLSLAFVYAYLVTKQV